MLVHLVETLLTQALNQRLIRRQPLRDAGSPAAGASAFPEDHVLVGHLIPQIPEIVALSPEARRRHLYLLGATGTGKTNLMLRLIESDIAQGRNFCVVDLRGDLVDRVLLRLAAYGEPGALAERTLLLDLRQEEFSVGFNPLGGAGDPYSRAFHVLSVLHRQADSWGVQLEETLRNCLIALAATEGTLLDIDPLLHRPPFRQEVLSQVADSQVQAFFERYGRLSGDRQMTWSLPVMNKITPLLAIPRLRNMFGQREAIPFRDLLDSRSGSIVLISLAVDRLQQAAYLVGSLLVSAFQTAIMARVDQPEKQRVPVHLYVDEFETMATEQFETIIAEGRRFGLGLCLSHQNLSQLSVSLRHVLRNNVHTQMYFQTGALDATELAQEITSGEPRGAIRAALMTQQVGEAYLVRRGQPDARIRVLHSPDPAVDLDVLRTLRAAALASHARPAGDVARDMAHTVAVPVVPQDNTPPRTSEEDHRTPDEDRNAAPVISRAPRKPSADKKNADKKNANEENATYDIRHAPIRRKLGAGRPATGASNRGGAKGSCDDPPSEQGDPISDGGDEANHPISGSLEG